MPENEYSRSPPYRGVLLATLFLAGVALGCLQLGLDTDQTQLILTVVMLLADRLAS